MNLPKTTAWNTVKKWMAPLEFILRPGITRPQTMRLFRRFHSVVVITFASHAKGPRFETGWKQICLPVLHMHGKKGGLKLPVKSKGKKNTFGAHHRFLNSFGSHHQSYFEPS